MFIQGIRCTCCGLLHYRFTLWDILARRLAACGRLEARAERWAENIFVGGLRLLGKPFGLGRPYERPERSEVVKMKQASKSSRQSQRDEAAA